MKLLSALLLVVFTPLTAHAEWESWTNSQGKTVELEWIENSSEGENLQGKFTTRDGRTVTIAASSLSATDAKRLAEKTSAASQSPTVDASTASVFDEFFKENLQILSKRKLVPHQLNPKPTQFYVFYYTASWCPPCREFTPKLVRFYKSKKNPKFEIILVTNDEKEKDMLDYAKEDRMTWPFVQFSAAEAFSSKFNHGVSGIPSVIVCDLNGKILSKNGRNLEELESLIK